MRTRIRTLALLAAVVTVPAGLTACGGSPGVDDFCAQYQAIGEIEEADADQAKGELEELAGTVPDEAGDEVREAADLMAETFPADGDLEGAIESGSLSEADTDAFLAAAETLTTYGDATCQD